MSGATKQGLMQRFGGVYENSPWIASTTFDSRVQFASAAELAGAMRSVVDAAELDAKLALLRAHPDLAGKLAAAGRLTEDSAREQAGAGLDALTDDDRRTFTDLNERYRERFEFPFIMAVSGRSTQEILDAFKQRLNNSKETEMAKAIEEVHTIARLRIERLWEPSA